MEPTKENSIEWKKTVFQNIKSNKIVLFGAGEEAKRFYYTYSDKLNIVGITANYVLPNMKIEEELGIQVKPLNKVELRDCFIIIAIDYETSYIAVEKQLLTLGLEYGLNFIDSTVADALLSERKILISAGDCLLDAVTEMLCTNRKFRELYYIKHFYFLGHSKYYNLMYYRLCLICDVYLLNYHFKDKSNFYFLKQELQDNCQLVYVTTPEFRGYWPQTPKKESVINKYHVVPRYGHPVDFTMREDSNINAAVEKNMPVDELVKLLSDENFYSQERVLNNFKVSINVINHIDEYCDIKIADYFMENVSKMWLAKDYSHYQNNLLKEISIRIMKFLKCGIFTEQKYWDSVDYDIAPFTEMPIYPSVAKYLELEYINEKTKYKIRTYQGDEFFKDPSTSNKVYYGIEELTFEEYIRRYYDYCKTTKHLMEVW